MPKLFWQCTRWLWVAVVFVLIACGDASVTPLATTATTITTTGTIPATTSATSPTSAATTAPAVTTSTSASATTAPAVTTGSTSATTAPALAGTPTLAAGTFSNPIIDQDFPDPDSLQVGSTYYAYATQGGGYNIQAASSSDLVHWTTLSDALPTLPTWAARGYTWAPEVTTTADGKGYIMYFVAREPESGKQCIGVATGSAPDKPFASDRADPFICQKEAGGSIDPSSFVDADGSRYVLWKNDGNCCGLDTWLYMQKVSADGLTLQGQPTQLVKKDQGWEGNLIEAPTLFKHGNKYYLFYSANNYAGSDYAIGYAVADKISGPYTKPTTQPLVKTVPADGNASAVIGPGGQDIVTTKDGRTWLLYHSWDANIQYRRMNIDELTWNGDVPKVQPKAVPETAPKVP